jgi:hypothetical protein
VADAAIHSEHVQVFRCDIKPRSVGRSNVETELISEKNPKGIPWGIMFKHRQTYLKMKMEFYRGIFLISTGF